MRLGNSRHIPKYLEHKYTTSIFILILYSNIIHISFPVWALKTIYFPVNTGFAAFYNVMCV